MNKVRYLLEVNVPYPENYKNSILPYHFYVKERNIKKSKSLLPIHMMK